MHKKVVVFDLGGVLIDWSPKYLYRSIFNNESEMEYFLDNICTNEWNELQDAGRSLEEATTVLVTHFPEYETLIRMYYRSWTEMLKGSFPEVVGILKQLIDQKYRVFALTNWSGETFPKAMELYEFLHWFEGILVSGKEKLKKPDPAIFNLLVKRFQLIPSETIFIDDNKNNVLAAAKIGFRSLLFTGSSELKHQLEEVGIRLD